MARLLHVHLLPDLVPPESLAGDTVVVIDILRASTTIVEALANGAREVIPCLEVEEARRVAASLPQDEVRLGGERGGLPIAGFDFGNSPAEYTAERVRGRTLVFTTTNGTRAMQRCRQAACVLIGAFVNRRAVIETLTAASDVHLLCAGTRGEITREDVLFAGSIVAELQSPLAGHAEVNDQAAIAEDAWRGARNRADAPIAPDELTELLKNSRGGRNLQAIGLTADIRDVARLDRHVIVPELDLASWRITVRDPLTR